MSGDILVFKHVKQGHLQWALSQVHNKAYGGKNGFCLDEVFPTLFDECERIEKENAKLRECVEFIANDNQNEMRMVCGAYTELKEIARETLKELEETNCAD